MVRGLEILAHQATKGQRSNPTRATPGPFVEWEADRARRAAGLVR